jgi:hypothetical protein
MFGSINQLGKKEKKTTSQQSQVSKMPEYWMGSKTHLRALGFSSGSSFSKFLNLALTALTGTGTAPRASMLRK